MAIPVRDLLQLVRTNGTSDPGSLPPGLLGYSPRFGIEIGETLVVEWAPRSISVSCMKCNKDQFLIRNGTKVIKCYDVPFDGKRVMLLVARQRFRCARCGRNMSSPLPFLDEHHCCTNRLKKFILQKCEGLLSYSEVSREVGITAKTVKAIFEEAVAPLMQRFSKELPAIFSIDNITLNHKPKCVISDPLLHMFVKIFDGRTTEDITTGLNDLKKKGKVYCCITDLSSKQRSAVRKSIPDVILIADIFHVYQTMLKHRDEVLKRVGEYVLNPEGYTPSAVTLPKKKLPIPMNEASAKTCDANQLLLFDQEYLEALSFKVVESFQRFHEILESSSSSGEAMQSYSAWIQSLTAETAALLRPFIATIDSWKREIFAYFDLHLTNGFAESINALISKMNSRGYGYDDGTLNKRMVALTYKKLHDDSMICETTDVDVDVQEKTNSADALLDYLSDCRDLPRQTEMFDTNEECAIAS